MNRNRSVSQWMLLAALLPGSLVASNAFSQSSQATQKPTSTASAPAKPSSLSTFVPRQAQMYYLGLWGIDSLRVKYTESGEMIRFTYRVVDPAKAAPLNNGKAEPYLCDPQAGVKLVVPQMEKVGPEYSRRRPYRKARMPSARGLGWVAGESLSWGNEIERHADSAFARQRMEDLENLCSNGAKTTLK